MKSEIGESVATTDLCVYFLLRAFTLVAEGECFGLLLSDVVGQGDSRESGLLRILNKGGTIYNAIATRHWPGTAGVKVAHVHVQRGEWKGTCILNGRSVTRISSFLREEGEIAGDPHTLASSTGICFTGHYLMGQGFVVSKEESKALISQNPVSDDIIFPYIRGDDINNEITQATENNAINFGMRELNESQGRYPECLERIRLRVKPERDAVKRKSYRERWWRYAEARPGLHKAIEHLEEVIVQPFTAKYLNFSYVPSRSVFAHPLVVLTEPSPGRFAVLLSCFHEAWVREYCSTGLDLMRYTASRVFDTFAFPILDKLVDHGRRLRERRDSLRKSCNQSLNEIYNRFHESDETAEDIRKLRELHVELDQAVSAAYGWRDLGLGHGFYETKQGLRYTINEPARREVLQRLLKLNHERYEEEVKQGLHDKKKKKGKSSRNKRKAAKKSPKKQEATLFGMEGDE